MMPDLTQYLWIVWLVLALLFVIVELLTLEFTFLMLAAGALIGGLGVNLLGGPWWLQVGAAAAISALLLFTIRPLLLRALRRSSGDVKTNVDALYGIDGRVVAAFVEGDGSVKLDNGETWTARAASGILDADLAPGDSGAAHCDERACHADAVGRRARTHHARVSVAHAHLRNSLLPSHTIGSYLRSAARSFIGISALSVILMCSGQTSVQHLVMLQ